MISTPRALTALFGLAIALTVRMLPGLHAEIVSARDLDTKEDEHLHLRHHKSIVYNAERFLASSQSHVTICAARCTVACLKAKPKALATCAANYVSTKCTPFTARLAAVARAKCIEGVKCTGGRRCPDKTCAKSAACCPGERRCPNGSCVGAGKCCPGQTLCSDMRTCVAPGVCCPDQKKCEDGSCIGVNEKCDEEIPKCSDGSDRPDEGCCSDEKQCDGDLKCVLDTECCSDEVTCSDGTCASSNELCGYCGDGTCNTLRGETIANCRVDCLAAAVCGDGLCDAFLGETTSTCAADCGLLPVECGDGVCDQSIGESVASCRWDCFTGPAECGDGYCDLLLGESETTCAADCYQGQMVEDFLTRTDVAGIPRSSLEAFPSSAILQVLQDSPYGFLLGTPQVTSDNVIQNATLSFTANNDSTIILWGTFVPESGSVPAGSVVRAYSPYAVETAILAEGQVGGSGQYSLVITDLHLGITPILLTFTPPPPATPSARRISTIARSTPTTDASPTLVWCVNNQKCPAPLTIKLTWSGHSDADLHVVEPSGFEVYFAQPSGTVGYLDRDNTQGFGPEHYYYTAELPAADSLFQFFVHLFSRTEDETFTLQVFNSGKQVAAYSGQLTDDGQNSEPFSVLLPGTGSDDTCAICPFTDERARNLVDRALVDYTQIPKKCNCVEGKKYKSWWCNRAIYRPFCSDSDLSEAYITWQWLRDMEPTQANVRAGAYMFLGVLLHGREGQAEFEVAMQQLHTKPGGDFLCAKYHLLDAYCQLAWAQDVADWLNVVNALKKAANFIATMATKGTSEAAKQYLVNKAKADAKFMLSIDNVFGLATQLFIIPTLAKGFAAKATFECGFI